MGYTFSPERGRKRRMPWKEALLQTSECVSDSVAGRGKHGLPVPGVRDLAQDRLQATGPPSSRLDNKIVGQTTACLFLNVLLNIAFAVFSAINIALPVHGEPLRIARISRRLGIRDESCDLAVFYTP